MPGVTAVAFTDSRPPDDAGNQNNFDLEDTPTRPGQSQPVTTWVDVTPEYFLSSDSSSSRAGFSTPGTPSPRATPWW